MQRKLHTKNVCIVNTAIAPKKHKNNLKISFVILSSSMKIEQVTISSTCSHQNLSCKITLKKMSQREEGCW